VNASGVELSQSHQALPVQDWLQRGKSVPPRTRHKFAQSIENLQKEKIELLTKCSLLQNKNFELKSCIDSTISELKIRSFELENSHRSLLNDYNELQRKIGIIDEENKKKRKIQTIDDDKINFLQATLEEKNAAISERDNEIKFYKAVAKKRKFEHVKIVTDLLISLENEKKEHALCRKWNLSK